MGKHMDERMGNTWMNAWEIMYLAWFAVEQVFKLLTPVFDKCWSCLKTRSKAAAK